jgi:hypothetical protein
MVWSRSWLKETFSLLCSAAKHEAKHLASSREQFNCICDYNTGADHLHLPILIIHHHIHMGNKVHTKTRVCRDLGYSSSTTCGSSTSCSSLSLSCFLLSLLPGVNGTTTCPAAFKASIIFFSRAAALLTAPSSP